MTETRQHDQSKISEITKVTAEMVRQVADKVWAMWLQDLAIERERMRQHQRR